VVLLYLGVGYLGGWWSSFLPLLIAHEILNRLRLGAVLLLGVAGVLWGVMGFIAASNIAAITLVLDKHLTAGFPYLFGLGTGLLTYHLRAPHLELPDDWLERPFDGRFRPLSGTQQLRKLRRDAARVSSTTDARSTGAGQAGSAARGDRTNGRVPKLTLTGRDPYRVLDLTSSATVDEIKSRYRDLMKRYHPDRLHHLGEQHRRSAHTRCLEYTLAYRAILRRRVK
jgi:hypothetical protein